MIIALVLGILTGFIVSVPPLGPIAFALISKGFRGEFKEGMAIAAGSAFMDMIYAIIAFGGISLFLSLLPDSLENSIDGNMGFIRILLIYAGCVVVIIYGFKIMRSKIDYSSLEQEESIELKKAKGRAEQFAKKHNVPVDGDSSFTGLFFMGILLCISSITLPASWFALVGYIKGLRIMDGSILSGLVFSIGAFLGTMLWFWLLLFLITGNKHRINKSTLGKLNITAGYILFILGAVLFIKATGTVFGFM
ncbi:MAG: LysE family translocator [Ignavibacteria bacterium]|nr:LysE family translocator [Ignavibacteria bacterium]